MSGKNEATVDTTSHWSRFDDRQPLESDDILVCRSEWARERVALPRLAQLLSPEEQVRAKRYRFEADRNRHVVLWAGLRLIIGSVVNASPRALEFERSAAGKPALSSPPLSLSFNATHAGAFVVFALSWGGPVGVDVEEVRPEVETEEIVDRFFHPHEQRDFGTLPEDLKSAAFFRSWTLKESYLKACGVGLRFGLDRVHVTTHPRKQPRLIAVEGMPGEQDRWSLADLPMGDGCFGAVTTQGRSRDVQLLDLDLARLVSATEHSEDI